VMSYVMESRLVAKLGTQLQFSSAISHLVPFC
jgi:hypothetical protein